MRLGKEFYRKDVLEVAPLLLGKFLVRRFEDGRLEKRKITEVEAYGGEEDLASHARFGKTLRNRIMWEEGGLVYVYFVYGMYWMFNITTGSKGEPQAVLLRSVDGIDGPGRLGRWLGLDKSFYGEDLVESNRIWLEGGESHNFKIKRLERVGVTYAGSWAEKKWRFILEE